MKRLILAHDLGTTGNKAVLVDEDGALVDTAFASYRTAHPVPLAAEQNPADWWRAVVRCTRILLQRDESRRGRLVTVGFSGHMNGVVLVDEEGTPLRPALIHADIRAQQQCEQLRLSMGEERYYTITGNRIAPFYSLPRLMMLAEREPEMVQRARWMIQCKDYCVGRLTGRWGITDPSDASLTGIYDVNRLRWSEEVVEASGVPAGLLPEVVPSTEVVGCVSREAARTTGLPEGLPVVIGAGDGACATLGAGVVETGESYTYIGGTAWISCLRERFTPDPYMRLTTLMAAQPHRRVQFGTVQSAGSAWDWFVRLFGRGMGTVRLQEAASGVPPGSGGLIFLPYLSGERAPIWNPRAKGVFFGLQAHCTRAHLARAVLEGVSCALESILQVMREHGAIAGNVRVVGGGTRSDLWMRILADVYGCPVEIPRHAESSTAIGAAVIAGVGVGLFENFAVAKLIAVVERRVVPEESTRAAYVRLKVHYKELYEAVKTLFTY
ncbi:MAG: xylulokinase [Armatimonadota bacterium]|nr:MAG: xylulokinase [Armatimonadota bacterium]